MYNTGKMLGMLTGIVVGIVIVFFVLRFINRDRSYRTEYDERQLQARGNAYKTAFYAAIISAAVLAVLSTGFSFPAEPFVLYLLPVFVGITVQVCCCIWNDAYVGMNTNMPRYIAIMAVISAFNLLVFAMAWKSGDLFEGGKLQAPTINLIVGLMFAVIGIAGLVRKLADREVEA